MPKVEYNLSEDYISIINWKTLKMTSQLITIQTKLKFASQEDKQKVMDVLLANQVCFNFCSDKQFGQKKNSIVDLHKACYYPLRQLYPNFKSQVIIKAENECLSAYKTIKANKHKIDKPIQKTNLSAGYDQRLFTYKDYQLRLTTLDKRIIADLVMFDKLKFYLAEYKFGDIILFARKSEIFVNIPFKLPTPEVKSGLALGVDLGIRRFATTSEGNLYQDKKFNADKRKLRYLKRCLQRKNTKSAKLHLKKLRSKEQNVNHNFNHHLANSILQTKCTTIVLEDLNVIKLKAKRTRYQNKNRISQVGFANLCFILTYKAALAGKQVVCVSPYYTSQIDHQNGKKEGERKGCRFYSKSGFVYDADVNAAINIGKRSNHPISQGNPLDGQGFVKSPLRQHCAGKLPDLSGSI